MGRGHVAEPISTSILQIVLELSVQVMTAKEQ